MNRRTVIILAILLAFAVSVGATGASLLGSANVFQSFTLTASGTAFDTVQHKTVPVTLSVTGTASGNLKSVINLHVKGGTVNVDSYSIFYVSSGMDGQIKQGSRNFKLDIKLLSDAYGGYGGPTAILGFEGTATKIQENTYSVSFTGTRETFPSAENPTITNIVLTGTVVLG